MDYIRGLAAIRPAVCSLECSVVGRVGSLEGLGCELCSLLIVCRRLNLPVASLDTELSSSYKDSSSGIAAVRTSSIVVFRARRRNEGCRGQK